MGVAGQRQATAALLQGKTRYPLFGRLGEPHDRLRKISPLPGFDPRTVQALAVRYCDYAISAHMRTRLFKI